jgi:hypothetical protein
MLKDNTRELPGGVAKYAEADVFTCPSGPMQVHGCASAHCVCSVFVPSTPVGKQDLSRDDWCSRDHQAEAANGGTQSIRLEVSIVAQRGLGPSHNGRLPSKSCV